MSRLESFLTVVAGVLSGMFCCGLWVLLSAWWHKAEASAFVWGIVLVGIPVLLFVYAAIFLAHIARGEPDANGDPERDAGYSEAEISAMTSPPKPARPAARAARPSTSRLPRSSRASS